VHSYIVQRVLSIRRAYRDCCGQKIVYLLAQEGIKLSLSTVYRLLRQYRQLRKHTRTAKGQPARRGQAPREVVQMDTVELGEVFAFTAIDTYTREAFILMRPGLTSADGKAALEELARRFGPIQTLQTDAGSEFEAQFLAVVNQYAQQHVIARPYRKNDQAFIECFNGTLRREEFGRTPFKRSDLALAQRRADDYLAYYHHQRPSPGAGHAHPCSGLRGVAFDMTHCGVLIFTSRQCTITIQRNAIASGCSDRVWLAGQPIPLCVWPQRTFSFLSRIPAF
jgi:transposase InsO family protein